MKQSINIDAGCLFLTYCIAHCDTERGLITLLFRITELYVTIHFVYKCYLIEVHQGLSILKCSDYFFRVRHLLSVLAFCRPDSSCSVMVRYRLIGIFLP